MRRRVALNSWVSPEVAFSNLVKWLAHERLENLLCRGCDTLQNRGIATTQMVVLLCKLAAVFRFISRITVYHAEFAAFLHQ